ncbi:hypothetical protein J2J97_32230 (plasmid) [Rhizobium bangladeshense]|uniref:hypothetical protein n=1 Tax=Rhizobium bangladeshense TaxID=1138189 RepID=UPI001A999999|nr:hypothetical protein [Rhizobium bangladeshense]QSY98574.1 hypothetical protein J2J97_32230 [Rhizobium bangladeshense]
MNDLQRHLLTHYRQGRYAVLLTEMDGVGPLREEYIVREGGGDLLLHFFKCCAQEDFTAQVRLSNTLTFTQEALDLVASFDTRQA